MTSKRVCCYSGVHFQRKQLFKSSDKICGKYDFLKSNKLSKLFLLSISTPNSSSDQKIKIFKMFLKFSNFCPFWLNFGVNFELVAVVGEFCQFYPKFDYLLGFNRPLFLLCWHDKHHHCIKLYTKGFSFSGYTHF